MHTMQRHVQNFVSLKNVQIRSFFCFAFPYILIGYGDLRSKSPYIQSEYRKIRTRKSSVFDHFSCSGSVSQNTLSQTSEWVLNTPLQSFIASMKFNFQIKQYKNRNSDTIQCLSLGSVICPWLLQNRV